MKLFLALAAVILLAGCSTPAPAQTPPAPPPAVPDPLPGTKLSMDQLHRQMFHVSAGRRLKPEEIKVEVADDRVPERLSAAAVLRHVMRCPTDPEILAAQRQVPDEGGQRGVEGVAARLRPQAAHCRDLTGNLGALGCATDYIGG